MSWDDDSHADEYGERRPAREPGTRWRDTDGGLLDGDTMWDRAVGPMQFIPSTWVEWASNANGDDVADPNQIDDAALTTARYLCASGSMTNPEGWRAAVFSYNHDNDVRRRRRDDREQVRGLSRPDMNIPTLMTKVAALTRHPIPISKQPAPYDADNSVVIAADAAGQIGRVGRLRQHRNRAFARHDGSGRGGAELVLRTDILVPEGAGAHPLVVFVPGGGFVRSPKVAGGRMRRALAAAGYVVASIEYRTTRHGATYLDGLADVRAAVRFLRANAEEFHIDPAKVALWGESAGGYLAALAGATDGDRRFDPDGDARIQAVIDKFGASDLRRLADGFDQATIDAVYAPGNAIARYVHGPHAVSLDDDPAAVTAADPTTYVSASTPPFLIFHGSDDRIISPVQTELLHRALVRAGADSVRYLVTGAGHGDIAVKGGEEKYWTTASMLTLMTDFLAVRLSSTSSDGD